MTALTHVPHRVTLLIRMTASAAFLWLPHSTFAANFPLSSFDLLQGVIVYDIHEDSSGEIWLGSEMGVWRWRTNGFELVSAPTGRSPSNISSDWGRSAHTIASDTSGTLWIGTGHGLLALDMESLEPRPVPPQLATLPINRLKRMPDGTVWAGTIDGLHRLAANGDTHSVTLIERTTGMRVEDFLLVDQTIWVGTVEELIEIRPDGEQFHLRDEIEGRTLRLHHGANGAIWVGHRGKPGLYRLNADGIRKYTAADGLLNDEVNSIAERANGEIWIGTERGVFRFRNNRFEAIDRHNGLLQDDVHAVLIDFDDQIWIGTFGGGAYLLRSPEIRSFSIEDGLTSPFVASLAKSGDAALVVGSLRGYCMFDLESERGLPSDEFTHASAIASDSKGRTWIACRSGAVCLETGATHAVPGTILGIAIDHSDRPIVATSDGLFRIDGDTIVQIPLKPEADSKINAIFIDKSGRLIVGTQHGIAVKKDEDWQWIETDSSFVSLGGEVNGDIWAGTRRSAIRIRLDSLETVERIDDLRLVQCISALPNGTVWFGTDFGIVYLAQQHLHRITRADGLPSDDVRALVPIGSDLMFAGTTHGLARINYSEMDCKREPPRITMQMWSLGDTLTRSEEGRMEIPSSDQGLVAEVIPLGQRQKIGTKYQYRIRGHSEHWSDWSTEQRVRLPQLPAGVYIAEFQARGIEGAISQPASTVFTVVPPLWRHGGFLTAMGTIFIGTLGGGVYLVKRRTHYRKRIENSERRFRTLVESLSVIPYQASASESSFRYVGPQSLTLLGHDSSVWTQDAVWQSVFPAEDALSIRSLWVKARARGEHCVADHRIRCASGELRWVRHIAGVVGGDEAGGENVGLISGLMVDITAEKRAAADEKALRAELESAVADRTAKLTAANESLKAEIQVRCEVEAALRESEQRFSTIFHRSPIAMIVSSLTDGVILNVNDAHIDLFGYTRDELVGRPELSVIEWRNIDERAKMIEKLNNGETVSGFTTTLRTKTGQDRICRIAAESFAQAGRQCLLTVSEDITENMQYERELERHRRFLHQLIDVNPHIIFAKDLLGRFTLANQAVADFYGTTTADLLGKLDSDFNTKPDEVAYFREIDQRAIESRQKQKVEETVTDRTGSRRHLETIKLPLLNNDGVPFGVLGVATDITARKQAEDALRRANEELEQRVRERTESLQTTRQFLERVLEYSPSLIFIKDSKGQTVFSNRMAESAPDSTTPKLVDDLFPAESNAEQWSRIAYGTSSVTDECTVHRDGRTTWYHVARVPLPGADGRPQVLGIATDFTEQKLAEQRIRESERLLQSTTDAVPGAVYKYRIRRDGSQSFDFMSRGAFELYGVPAHELVKDFQLTWSQIVPEDVAPMEKSIRLSAARGEPWNHEFRIRTPDGELKWLRGHSRPEPADTEGDIIWNGILTDITAQKTTEQLLRDSIDRFELVAAGSIDGLWDAIVMPGVMWSSPQTPIYYSSRFKQLLGFEEHEFPDVLGSWSERLHPEDVDRVMSALEDHIVRRVPYEIEYRLRTRSEEYRWYQARGQARWTDDGQIRRMAGSLNDITQRKLAEERLRRQALVFDNMYDGVLLTNTDGIIIDANPGAEQMFGYSRESMIGNSPEMLNHPDDARKLTERIQSELLAGHPWSGEIRFIRRDGSEGYCEAFLVPMYDENGRRNGTVSVNRNITDRKKAEAEKRMIEQQLIRSAKMQAVGTLASGIAHEFTDLLTMISINTEAALRYLSDSHPSRQPLDSLKATAKHAQGVLSSLLTFSRNTPLSQQKFDLTQVALDTVKILGHGLSGRIVFRSELPLDQCIWILGRPTEIGQAIFHLAFNAQDAMPDGGDLSISLKVCGNEWLTGADGRIDAGLTVAVLAVEDTGCGIPQEHLERIFEPFFTTKEPGKGTGLGLSIIHRMVEEIGGTIQVLSQVGAGTTIRMILPCCEPPSETNHSANDSRASNRFAGRLVIVVERDPHKRSIVVSTLRTIGCEVKSFAELDQAIELAENRPNWIPVMVINFDATTAAGVQRVATLRRAVPNLQIIAIARTLSVNLRRSGLDNCRFLRPPFETVDLRETVEECLIETSDPNDSDYDD
ncbi:MAG: PAS domain S-box protein [Phycisphaerae bacterium]|nr:PAS domain S-box protein [Phycisphaerae bacterium]